MGLVKNFKQIDLLPETVEGITFFSPLSSNETVLFKIAPQTVDDLFCHQFQTDRLLVVRGQMVLVCLQNREYHYIPMSDKHPQVVEIPAGLPHLVINLSQQPCWMINALTRQGDFHFKDYQPLRKPFPIDFNYVKRLFRKFEQI